MSVFDEEDHQITSPQVEDPITEVGSPITVGSPARGQENPLSATHSHPPTTVMHGSMRSSDGSDSEPQINRSAPPIDDDDSSPSSSKAQLDLASPLFLLISFATLVLFAVAAPIRWFYRVQPAARTDYTLWQMTMQTTLAYQHATVGDYPCAEEARYYRNIEAFVLISIAGAVAMTIVGVLAWRGIVASVKIPATVTAAFTFVASLVCWGTAISLYFSEFCGTESFKRRRFDYDAGPVLVIVGWVFTAVSIVIVWVQPQISWPLTDRAAYRLVSKWYGALVIPAAIFSVILVPIPLFYYWSTQNDQIEISSFHYKYYKNDVLVGSVATGGTYCGQFGEVARVSQAFGIILIILSWSALVAWVLHYRSEATEYRPALYVVTAIAFLAAGIKLAMDIALYFEDYCDMGSLVDGAYQQGAGFALTATMVALHGFNLVILTWSIVRAWLRAKNVRVNPKEQWAEFVYLAALLITLPLVIVSIWKPLLHASSPMADLTYSWWDVQQKTTSSTVTNDFPKDCKEIKQRMAGGGSLVIIAAALLLMALFLQIAQFLTPILKKPAGIMGLVASVPLLVAWGIAIAAKHHGMFCSDLLANDKTKISYGLAFVISSWVVVLLASITVLVVPSATTTNKK